VAEDLFCEAQGGHVTKAFVGDGGDGSLLKAQDYLRWALAGKAEDKR
jgi:hypothetical protein